MLEARRGAAVHDSASDPGPDSMRYYSTIRLHSGRFVQRRRLARGATGVSEHALDCRPAEVDYLDAAVSLDSLRAPPANQLEALKGDRKGQHSIRINRQYRVCFVWTADGPQHVMIVDYH